MPGVNVMVHPEERLGRARTRALSFDHRAPRLISLVFRETRRERRPRRSGSPRIAQSRNDSLELGLRATPWIIGRPGNTSEAAVQNQRRRALRVRRCEQRAHRPAFGCPENRSAFRTDRVHHGTNVVHSLFQRRDWYAAIGEARPTFVEPDESGDRCEPFHEVGITGFVPVVFEIGYEPWYVNQIEWPLSDHLVGDVEIAAARILRVRLHAFPLTTNRWCLGSGLHA